MTERFGLPSAVVGPLDAILAAFTVLAAVGIVFGHYPARKTSRLDPIHALRYK